MPTFKFTNPEGKTYRVEGPEGATQEQAWEMLQSQTGGLDFARSPAEQVRRRYPTREPDPQALAASRIPASEMWRAVLSGIIGGPQGAVQSAGSLQFGGDYDPGAVLPYSLPSMSVRGIAALRAPGVRTAPEARVPEAPLQLPPPRYEGTTIDPRRIAEARQEALRVRASGELPPEGSGPPIEMPPQEGQVPTPPSSQLLSSQLVREFGAVRKGVELREGL